MPEKVTIQEKIISLAIEKARKAKEELSAKKRKNIEPTQVLEIDTTNMTVTGVADSIASGSSDGGTQYSTSSSYST